MMLASHASTRLHQHDRPQSNQNLRTSFVRHAQHDNILPH